jgi:hypothetical protein
MNLRIIPFPSHRSRHTRRLPIVILRRRNLGPGAFTVMGDRYEEYAMSLLVSSFRGSFEPFREQKSDPVLLFKPQISLLMRRFHSLLVLGFGSSNIRA